MGTDIPPCKPAHRALCARRLDCRTGPGGMHLVRCLICHCAERRDAGGDRRHHGSCGCCDPALCGVLDAQQILCQPLADFSPGAASYGSLCSYHVGIGTGVIPGSVSRGVRDGALLSSTLDASCPSVCPRAWWLAGCYCNARRARVAALTRQYPSPSRAFFGITSALLVLLAVIFVGKGIAAL